MFRPRPRWLILLSSGLFTFMSRSVLIFVAVALLLPNLALAKRVAPAKVEPVVYQGVRYIAPNDDGRRAYIEARDGGHRSKASAHTDAIPARYDRLPSGVDL
jgi:hypothetical protein